MNEILILAALVAFTGPGNKQIVINTNEVVSVRPQRGNFADSVECLIHTTDGKFITVIDNCESVVRKLEK